MAARGARAAAGPDSAHRRAHGHLREQSRPGSLGFGVHASRSRTLAGKEGANIRIERRWAEGDLARLRTQAAELARIAPDVLFAQGTPGTTALRQAAPTTPLVFVMITDPVSSGLVSSLGHPGGNITGFTNYEFSMGGKWLELLKAIAPGTTRVAVIFNPENPALSGQLRSIEAAGPNLAIQVAAKPARKAEEFERTIAAVAAEPNGGLLVLLDFVTLAHRDLIIRLAAQHRLPAGYTLRVFPASGGLIFIRCQLARYFSAGGILCRSRSQRRQACRSAGAAADQTRSRHQPEDRQGPRARSARHAARARR